MRSVEHFSELRRFKSYPTYKDTGAEWLGEIPAHWELRRLRQLLMSRKGAIKTGPFGSQLMVEHFAAQVQGEISGKAKAMIVARSRLHAVRYKLVVDRYLAE